MDPFDPWGDYDAGHGTTGRDFCLIAAVIGLVLFVASTFEQVVG